MNIDRGSEKAGSEWELPPSRPDLPDSLVHADGTVGVHVDAAYDHSRELVLDPTLSMIGKGPGRRGDYSPRLPQIRTCPSKASGSSRHGFAARYLLLFR
jgi:hypothetical protein